MGVYLFQQLKIANFAIFNKEGESLRLRVQQKTIIGWNRKTLAFTDFLFMVTFYLPSDIGIPFIVMICFLL